LRISGWQDDIFLENSFGVFLPNNIREGNFGFCENYIELHIKD